MMGPTLPQSYMVIGRLELTTIAMFVPSLCPRQGATLGRRLQVHLVKRNGMGERREAAFVLHVARHDSHDGQ